MTRAVNVDALKECSAYRIIEHVERVDDDRVGHLAERHPEEVRPQ